MGDANPPPSSRVPRRGSWRLPLVLALAFLAAQVPHWFRPVDHGHVWRQADTAAVTRNLIAEDFDLLRPRIDARQATSGITGMEFPAYQALAAGPQAFAGPRADWPGKVVSALMGLAAALLMGRLLVRRFGLPPLAAWPAAFASPLVMLYAGKYMPETTGLALALLGWTAYERWTARRGILAALLCWAAYALALLVRPFVAFLALPILADCLGDLRHGRWRPAATRCALGVAILVPFALWYGWWAPALTRASGLDYFFMGSPVAANLAAVFDPDQRFWPLLTKVLAQDYAGWLLLPVIVVGWWTLLEQGEEAGLRSRLRLVGWILPAVVLVGVVGATGRHFHPHHYYLIALVPALALALALGLERLGRGRRRVAVVLATAVVLVPMAVHWRQYAPDTRRYAPFAGGIVDEVRGRVDPHDLVAVELVRPTDFAFHLHPFRVRGWVLAPAQLVDRRLIRDCRDRGLAWVLALEEGRYRLYTVDGWLARVDEIIAGTVDAALGKRQRRAAGAR